MKLGFEETQASYDSGSQSARLWTERWVADWLYCPNCESPKVTQFSANRPVADFFCLSCKEEYELKSQKTPFKTRVVDGAFKTMSERLASSNNPNLLLMNYNLASRSVTDLLVVPKHFFVQETIEPRKPLSQFARRAGWVGCNILLNKIPAAGRVYFICNGEVLPKHEVTEQWRKTLFLRDTNFEARGWLLDVMKCVDLIQKPEFTLDDVYKFENRLSVLHPDNNNVRPKIRQQLQYLRDRSYLEFVSRGIYRLKIRTR